MLHDIWTLVVKYTDALACSCKVTDRAQTDSAGHSQWHLFRGHGSLLRNVLYFTGAIVVKLPACASFGVDTFVGTMSGV